MRMAVIVPFLNEEMYLGTLLESIGHQARMPDQLLLVDDGSNDGSLAVAEQFADERSWAHVVARPRRSQERDRLATAAELVAFTWGVEQLEPDWDVVGKLDADLRLTPACFDEIEKQLQADAKLGLAGAYLSIISEDGRPVRERCPPDHVRGATKFYRRQCFADVFPLPPALGWDTVDEVKARMHGWRTASFAIPGGDPIHLRPTATYDGALRGFVRSGVGTYAYGAHPLWMVLSGLRRVHHAPPVIGSLAYFAGWTRAAIRRIPRADPSVRRYVRREQVARLRAVLRPSRMP
jgi:biofilm PGA synthesis N-glycosyltransferase PgaC